MFSLSSSTFYLCCFNYILLIFSPSMLVILYSLYSSIISLYALVGGPTHVHHGGSTSTIDLVFVPDPSLMTAAQLFLHCPAQTIMESLWKLTGSLTNCKG